MFHRTVLRFLHARHVARALALAAALPAALTGLAAAQLLLLWRRPLS